MSILNLGFHLCTIGTPMEDMQAHSPPLPRVIDYLDKDRDEDRDVTTEDVEGIVFVHASGMTVSTAHLYQFRIYGSSSCPSPIVWPSINGSTY